MRTIGGFAHRRMFLADRGLACVWNLGDQHIEDRQIEARQKTRHVAARGISIEGPLEQKAKAWILGMMNDGLPYPLRLIILIII